MQHPKVAIIGAGSLFFGRQGLWQMAHSEHLNTGTLALVDTNPVNLKRMETLARKVIEQEGVELKLEVSTDAKEVLPESDFVVFSFADRSAKFRGIDCDVSGKYGVRMCSGDTIGPGGIFRTLREFPKILDYCKAVEEICPDAWVINYINPTAANGIGLRKFAPKLKSFALCDGLHMPHVKRDYAVRAGIISDAAEWSEEIDRNFLFRIAGPNHFTWLVRAEYNSKNVVPAIAEVLSRESAKETDGGDTGSKAWFNETVTLALYKTFGFVPTCTGHTKEYFRFWQGLGTIPEQVPPLSLWSAADRHERHAEMWAEVDGYALGSTSIGDYMSTHGPDHATDIIETMWGGLKKPFFINTANDGTVTNMPDDAFLEMLCDLSMDGPKPLAVGDAPVGLRGLWQQVLDAHELAVTAAVIGNRDTLLQAFLCDPMISSIEDSKAIIAELLEIERDALPDYWY